MCRELQERIEKILCSDHLHLLNGGLLLSSLLTAGTSTSKTNVAEQLRKDPDLATKHLNGITLLVAALWAERLDIGIIIVESASWTLTTELENLELSKSVLLQIARKAIKNPEQQKMFMALQEAIELKTEAKREAA